MTDYKTLIDAETWAFIEKTNSYYPPDTIDYTIVQQRAIYDRMCREFFAGYPQGVSAETTAVANGIPVRIYRNAKPNKVATVLYAHGGGFILGGLDSHDDVCAELCARTGFEVVSVDYRLAPEHLHPAAFDDAMDAFEWAARTYDRAIVLCGDSAGGNLCAAVAHATRGHVKKPAGQMLIYPGLGGDHSRDSGDRSRDSGDRSRDSGDRSRDSYVTHAEAPMLTVRDLDFYRHIRTAGVDRTGDITLYPLADADFANLPPTVLVTAQCDPLSSDGEAYRDRIVAAGGRATWFEEPGLVHGYLRARHMVGRARTSFTRIVEAVSALGRGDWIW